ncbi:hypothetical protein BC939DRAFT_449708 [Gamsiella multidivaricata]|uniref:uncharacterized protein n=1 Tax=Gamsiella multidivaricata TaxID=101098 RepID=UPI0022207AF2|nr:uncharacterized protein BC939DRAFT_449708 [Gamsiella multidivaricata]KAI7824669.1 hypothetical protein BC939DRAFT_449708 [Gamsiella multidivaricata]
MLHQSKHTSSHQPANQQGPNNAAAEPPPYFFVFPDTRGRGPDLPLGIFQVFRVHPHLRIHHLGCCKARHTSSSWSTRRRIALGSLLSVLYHAAQDSRIHCSLFIGTYGIWSVSILRSDRTPNTINCLSIASQLPSIYLPETRGILTRLYLFWQKQAAELSIPLA